MSITIEEMQKQVFNLAKEKGWWPLEQEGPNETDSVIVYGLVNIPEKLMLMVSELGEALEHYRGPDGITTWFINESGNKEIYSGNIPTYSKPDGFWIELADCVIRIMDLCGAYDIGMEGRNAKR
jgi:hypothetical protein